MNLFLLFIGLCFADEAIHIKPVHVEGSFAFVDHWTVWLSQPHVFLATFVPILWDVLRRLFPTDQSAGFFHDVGRFLRDHIGHVSGICYRFGDFFVSLGKAFDKILPQVKTGEEKKE